MIPLLLSLPFAAPMLVVGSFLSWVWWMDWSRRPYGEGRMTWVSNERRCK